MFPVTLRRSFTKVPTATPDPTIEAIRERSRLTWAHMERIAKAVEEAGFDPEMLNYLPPGHIAAALALGVK